MNIRANIVVAVATGLALSSQVYAAGHEQGNGHMPSPRPEFSSVDTNSDNEITFTEFSQQELPGGDAQSIFSEMDSNSDDVISHEEFENFEPPRPPRQ